MNGNELANILEPSGRVGVGTSGFGQGLPLGQENWFEKKYEKPERSTVIPRDLIPDYFTRLDKKKKPYWGEEEKDLSKLSRQLADILSSVAYKWEMSPKEQAEVLKTFYGMKDAISKRIIVRNKAMAERETAEEEKGIVAKAAEEAKLTPEEFTAWMERGQKEGWKSWQYLAGLMTLGVEPDRSQYIGKLMAPEPGALEAAQADALRYKTSRTKAEDYFLLDYIDKNPQFARVLLPNDKLKSILNIEKMVEDKKKEAKAELETGESKLTPEEVEEIIQEAKEKNLSPYEVMLKVLSVAPGIDAASFAKVLVAQEEIKPSLVDIAKVKESTQKIETNEAETAFLVDFVKRNPEYEVLLAPTSKAKLVLELEKQKSADEIAKDTGKRGWAEIELERRGQDIGHNEFVIDTNRLIGEHADEMSKFMTVEERLNRTLDAGIENRKNTLNLEVAKFGYTKELGEKTHELAKDKLGLLVQQYGLAVGIAKAKDEQFWAGFGLKEEKLQQEASQWVEEFALKVAKQGLEATLLEHNMDTDWAKIGIMTKDQEDKMQIWADKKEQWKKDYELEFKDVGIRETLANHGITLDWAEFGLKEEELAEIIAQGIYDRGMRGMEFEQKVKDQDRQYELNKEVVGETAANNLRNYNIRKLTENHAWQESLFNMGFKDKEFAEASRQFVSLLDFNKEKEITRAEEFGLTLDFDKTKEAGIIDRFDKSLKVEWAKVDIDAKNQKLDETVEANLMARFAETSELEKEKLALNRQIEARISRMAIFNFGLDVKKLGQEAAVQKWLESEAEKKWYWKEKEFPLTEKKALAYYKSVMHKIVQDTKDFGFKVAQGNEIVRQFKETMIYKYKALEAKGEDKIEIVGDMAVALDSLGTEKKDAVIKALTASIGYTPSDTVLEKTGPIIFGEPGEKSPEKLPVNLPLDEYINAVMGRVDLSEKAKGWLIRARIDAYLREGYVEAAIKAGNYINPEEEEETEGSSLLNTLASPFRAAGKIVRAAGKKVGEWWNKRKSGETIDWATVDSEADRVWGETEDTEKVKKYIESQGLDWETFRAHRKALIKGGE